MRRRWAAADVAARVLDGYSRHQSARAAAALSYYGFFTLFPLLMVATTILGFLLEDNPELQQRILDSAVSQIPVIGHQIEANAGVITGNWWALVTGLVIALWGSLRAFVGIQMALDDVWEIPVAQRANGALRRAKALIGVAVIGGGQVGSVVLASIVSYASLPFQGRSLIALGGVALNTLVVAAMYRFLTSRRVSWREVWPGALLTGFGYSVLHVAGTTIMGRTLKNAQEVYGAFAGTLGLLVWMTLLAVISLFGAELNAALAARAELAARDPANAGGDGETASA